MDDSAKIKNFNLVNCYVDTSYQEWGTQNIITSRFNNEIPQTQEIGIDFTVVADDGYKLNKDFSFEFTGYRTTTRNLLPPETITFDKFVEPKEEIKIIESLDERESLKFAGIDDSKTLVFTKEIDGVTQYHLFLVGGFNPDKLTFMFFNMQVSSDTYDGSNISLQSFTSGGEYDPSIGGYAPEISLLNNLNFVAESEKPIEPSNTKNIFTTYYVDNTDLAKIQATGTVSTEIILNTYSYPINFNDEYLEDSKIKSGFVSTELPTKVFTKLIPTVKIFEFEVPDIDDVKDCYCRIPFNQNINLDYEEIRNTTIQGVLHYEILTNTTTLIISNEIGIIYKNLFNIGVKIPYKTTGQLTGYSEPDFRLVNESPKLILKGLKKSIGGNYLKGSILLNSNRDILKNEIELLEQEVKNGILINEKEF